MEGQTLLHYEIVRLLGRGGMGEVYLARDTKLGRDVALKLLPPDLKNDAERRARFEREAQAVAALNHPHVVTVHAVEEAEGRPFLVMEYVDGKTLEDEIPAGGMGTGRFFATALDLTGAVAAAHGKGITHRDLKPQNVMFDGEGRLRVLDFGLAKLFETPATTGDMTITAGHVTVEGVIVGTAAYMSPEQAEGKPVDVRSDVFSLGILLYQMSTGQRPFEGDTQMSTLTAVLRDDPQPVVDLRPDLPRQLARIIRRCLEKDPSRRYESARGLHYDLEILREEMDSGEHEAPVTAISRDGGRGGVPWRIVAGAAVIVAAVGGYAWFGRDGGTEPAAAGADPVAAEVAVEPTIVVFPFENLGPPEDAYFAAGVTEEIVTSLTGTSGLRVLSRTSAQQYDRAGKSLQQIGADLGVDYVLEGSVRWQRGADGASRVRVTPQLMETAGDRQLWADRYDRSMAEIFAVQTEIAGEVVRNLGVALTGGVTESEADIPTQDMTAYHAYLRGKEILEISRFDSSSWDLAVDLLEKATTRDPEFHAAWVQLAKVHAGMCHFNWDRTDARLARAKAAADRALALQPESSQSFFAQGLYHYWGLKDYERALEWLRRAEALRPDDPQVIETTAYVLRRQEAFDEAADLLVRLGRLSPRDAALATHVTETLAIANRFEESEEWGRRAMQLGPDQPMNFTFAAWAAMQGGRPDLARAYIDDMPPSADPEIHFSVFMVHYHQRDYAAALEALEVMPPLHPAQYVTICPDLLRAYTYQAMERDERAAESFALAERLLSAALEETPDASNLVSTRAVALAGIGRHEEALAEVERSFGLYPATHDPWIASWRYIDRARVEIMAGRHADAVQTLAEVLAMPTDAISPWILGASPALDDLRGREDFKALEARYR